MSDLSPTATATLACLNCGAQNAQGSVTCSACGSSLTAASGDADRGELEHDEVWRAAAVGGFDADFGYAAGDVTCSSCGATFRLSEARGATRRPVRDTPSNRDDLVVVTAACPRCTTQGRFTADDDTLATADDIDAAAPPVGVGDGDEVDESEVDHRGEFSPDDKTAAQPLGSDRRFFDDGGPGTLADRGSLLDEQGEDIRQYTGEPVETEEGWVIPVQQNVGPGNEAGGGEYPDANDPSAMPTDDQPEPPPSRA